METKSALDKFGSRRKRPGHVLSAYEMLVSEDEPIATTGVAAKGSKCSGCRHQRSTRLPHLHRAANMLVNGVYRVNEYDRHSPSYYGRGLRFHLRRARRAAIIPA